ncbi:MAG: UDP-N-acetylglucosamine 1-carboxyvinyltransferase [Candidatus Argoarchaeum ethanivorans]|uniref:UDP-N-acetylglucosamine 1-carboxyvinyltransferase n=1 Tax=Candidatus Argoarchaeum ethanivorans TaxID=2608793 RepID=A0A811TI42_9EURY|nr:MAG: UDP-N-acetylglucosamine 1-carboxyvinyltransferase [Candidatus Argoarchaeum ethanivorans]
MDEKIVIYGGTPLNGTVRISGSKNASLPIMCASLLSSCTVTLTNIPEIDDVYSLLKLLHGCGANTNSYNNTLSISCPKIKKYSHDKIILNRIEGYKKIRHSILLVGALLSKYKEVYFDMPGGCKIGDRPIDLHITGFKSLGAQCKIINDNTIMMSSPKGLIGDEIFLRFPSVGATENLLIASVLAEGSTIIKNAAIEPEIINLIDFLNAMGAKIKIAGGNKIIVKGVDILNGGVTHNVIPDRIEAGTFITMGAITRGDITIEHVEPKHLEFPINAFKDAGVGLDTTKNSIHLDSIDELRPVDICTHPYPGFPTDLQPLFATLMTQADGSSLIEERVFDSRFRYLNELKKMGAQFDIISNREIIVKGHSKLTGTDVFMGDIRGGAAILTSALVAEGKSEIYDSFYLYRGYEKIETKLRNLGARLKVYKSNG